MPVQSQNAPTAAARHARQRHWLAAAGSLLAGASVALAAYAAHGVEGEAQARLAQAAAFGFGHALALAALAPLAVRRNALAGLLMLLAGTLLFCGSLAGAVFAGVAPTLAPFGGGLLIAGWLLHGIDRLRG